MVNEACENAFFYEDMERINTSKFRMKLKIKFTCLTLCINFGAIGWYKNLCKWTYIV